jgi:hypothetical protein
LKLHVMQFYPSLLGPNILLSALFSNNLIVYSSFIARAQVSYPHKTTLKTLFPYFNPLKSKLVFNI